MEVFRVPFHFKCAKCGYYLWVSAANPKTGRAVVGHDKTALCPDSEKRSEYYCDRLQLIDLKDGPTV